MLFRVIRKLAEVVVDKPKHVKGKMKRKINFTNFSSLAAHRQNIQTSNGVNFNNTDNNNIIPIFCTQQGEETYPCFVQNQFHQNQFHLLLYLLLEVRITTKSDYNTLVPHVFDISLKLLKQIIQKKLAPYIPDK